VAVRRARRAVSVADQERQGEAQQRGSAAGETCSMAAMATRRQGRQGVAVRGHAVGATHSGDDDSDSDDGGGGGDSGGGDEARRGGVTAAMRGTQWRRWRRRQR